MSHTILLIQKTDKRSSRTFQDYEAVPQAIEGLVRQFEDRLKELNPSVRHINYDIDDLNRYIDSFGDLVALVYEERTMTYRPHDRAWVKQRVLQQLKRAATGGR